MQCNGIRADLFFIELTVLMHLDKACRMYFGLLAVTTHLRIGVLTQFVRPYERRRQPIGVFLNAKPTHYSLQEQIAVALSRSESTPRCQTKTRFVPGEETCHTKDIITREVLST